MDFEMILRVVQGALQTIVQYIYELIALLAPLGAFRFINWVKRMHYVRYGRKPNWVYMDLTFFLGTFGLSFWAWKLKYGDAEAATLVAIVVTLFSYGIVKWIFRRTQKSAPDVHAALFGDSAQDTLFTGARNDDDKTPTPKP